MVGQAVKALGGDARTKRIRQSASAKIPTDSASTSDAGFECYHVDARLSENHQQIGLPSLRKVFRLLRYCLEAIWCRFRYGVRNLYFVPAHAARSSMARDWMALAICRPFFRTLTYHWQAAGAGTWLDTVASSWERRLARAIMGRPNLSIVLLRHNQNDAVAFGSKRVEIIPNGIPDPCPNFDQEIAPRRRRRALARSKLLGGKALGIEEHRDAGGDPQIFRVLFLSLCCAEKGLFDTIEAVVQANQQAGGLPVRFELVVAGNFMHPAERTEFETRLRQSDLNQNVPVVKYIGFVSGEEKRRVFETSDCFCLPTFYTAESFGVVLIEAMAFGLPVITTRWRGLHELLPSGYPGLVNLQSPGEIAARLLALLREDYDDSLREWFLAHYTDAMFSQKLRIALANLK